MTDRRTEFMIAIKELRDSTLEMAGFYVALRNFLLELEALNDDRIKALFDKYQVKVE